MLLETGFALCAANLPIIQSIPHRYRRCSFSWSFADHWSLHLSAFRENWAGQATIRRGRQWKRPKRPKGWIYDLEPSGWISEKRKRRSLERRGIIAPSRPQTPRGTQDSEYELETMHLFAPIRITETVETVVTEADENFYLPG